MGPIVTRNEPGIVSRQRPYALHRRRMDHPVQRMKGVRAGSAPDCAAFQQTWPPAESSP